MRKVSFTEIMQMSLFREPLLDAKGKPKVDPDRVPRASVSCGGKVGGQEQGSGMGRTHR